MRRLDVKKEGILQAVGLDQTRHISVKCQPHSPILRSAFATNKEVSFPFFHFQS